MNTTYLVYTEHSDRFWRLEKIAKEVGREYAHFESPTLMDDILEAREENDELRDLLAGTVPVITK